MKLYYYKDPKGNFGDDLNVTFWEKYWPNYQQYSMADWLVGIGSIFTGAIDKLPGKKIIMGSGYWPTENGRPDLDSCIIGFVRGPLTCQALGVDEKYAIADPAVLAGVDFPRPTKLDDRIGFMPHKRTVQYFDCKKIADMADVRLIDATGPVENVLNELAKSSKVIVEAMHGAILADAMGVPWQRISIFNRRQVDKGQVDFKWQDWGTSLGLDTTPTAEYLLPWPGRSPLRRLVKKPYIEMSLRGVAQSIRKAIETGDFNLSSRQILSLKVEQIRERINAIKNNHF